MVHIRGARALLVMPHRAFPLPDRLGKAVWTGLALLGFSASSTSSFHGRAPLLAEKRSVEGKVDCVAVEADAMKHCQH
jgi:hypothetical protein